jgi:LysR family transcriptional regulator, glycine cleavage system transcriptional activator
MAQLPIPLSSLRAFEAAARTGSFSTAAKDLNLTPSAVSHAIRGLERSLGVALFLREGRSIRLTGEGEVLMHHVERGFGELQLGLGSLSAYAGHHLLRLHCAPSIAAQWLVPRLCRLLDETGGLEVRIAAGTDYTRFLADEFDADIVYGPPPPAYYGPVHRSVVMLPLGTETVTPLCAPALAERIRVPADLLAHTLIESDNKRVRWPNWFAANGMAAPEPRGPRFDRSFLSLSAAADGLGVALESTRLAERELASGRLVRPLHLACEDVVYTGHWLVVPRAKLYARSVILLTRWLGAELKVDLSPSGAVELGAVSPWVAPV